MSAVTPLEFTPQATPANKALHLEEPLIFDLDKQGRSGVDLPEPAKVKSRLGTMTRQKPVGLPGLSEPDVVRHYTRLSQKNFSIDAGMYPLGSCTMKHNPRLNEKMARLPGFARIHPLQPASSVQGAYELMHTLAHWLTTLTGMEAVALSPAAGAHGELCGMMCIKAAHEAHGRNPQVVLVPASAHGTNPATAAGLGYTVQNIPANADGTVDMEAFKAALNDNVAGAMITNPNTCGIFEKDLKEIADALHSVGAYLYCDGANYNAIVGRVRPADLGVDCMHINLHKTFSTPHGGGGPGSGPVVLSLRLAPYAPLPMVVKHGDSFLLLEEQDGDAAQAFGRIKAFAGQFGTFVRALSYMLSFGSDGLWQVATDAVLNANYVRVRLQDVYTLPFAGLCKHEVLFDDRVLKGTGISTLDLAKAIIDEGFHPMTMYFPLVVAGAMLIEPTETESKQTLDSFIDVMLKLAKRAQQGDVAYFKNAPYHTPRRRLDETAAARKPLLVYKDECL